jgi:hypothetical protein
MRKEWRRMLRKRKDLLRAVASREEGTLEEKTENRLE